MKAIPETRSARYIIYLPFYYFICTFDFVIVVVFLMSTKTAFVVLAFQSLMFCVAFCRLSSILRFTVSIFKLFFAFIF